MYKKLTTLVMVFVLLLSACAPKAAPTQAPATQPPAATTAPSAGVVKATPGKSLKMLLLPKALGNVVFDLARFGIQFVASPRHADMLLVTGPVSRHMAEALRRTHEATPEPKLVVAVGDCGCDGGIFGTSYASCGAVANVIPVDVAVPGCPPPPIDILRGILQAVKLRPARARKA